MTAEEIADYRTRWRKVAARGQEELRAMTVEQKLQQLSALMFSVDAMGWREALSDDRPVWDRWQRLRRRLGSG